MYTSVIKEDIAPLFLFYLINNWRCLSSLEDDRMETVEKKLNLQLKKSPLCFVLFDK